MRLRSCRNTPFKTTNSCDPFKTSAFRLVDSYPTAMNSCTDRIRHDLREKNHDLNAFISGNMIPARRPNLCGQEEGR